MLSHSAIMLASYAMLVFASKVNLLQSGSCSANFKICAPPGVKTDSLGPVGPAWGDLYNEIVDVVSGYGISQSAVGAVDFSGPARRDLEALCCANVADCLLVPVFDVAMCWDPFTTNVYFQDGTYGAVVSGNFNTSDGISINLVYGDYTMKNGTTGNIYSGSVPASAKPDTSTMSRPSPWTSSGLGSAIPATGLGTAAIISIETLTIPATTISLSTESSITITTTKNGCNHCPAYNTTIPGPTQTGGTLPAITITSSTGVITPTIVRNISNSIDSYRAFTFILLCAATLAVQSIS